jgi:hypothetical protein
MSKEDQFWKEYSILRDEMKQADVLKYQITGVIVAAVAAILVAGFNQSNLLVKP